MIVDQHRGVVVARNGAVAASQPLAVSAGLEILQQGGSFADAVIAISAVQCVVEPYNSHLGGDAFAIVFDAADGETTALNGSGAAPATTRAEHFRGGMPIRGMRAAAVPGLVDVWFTLHARWGTLPVHRLLRRAIEYAEGGYPAGYRTSRIFAANAELLQANPDAAGALLNGSRLPLPGDILVQPDVAWALRQIATSGRDAFYDGPIAERIVRYSEEQGGLFAREDLRAHRTEVLKPISTSYRGYTVHGQPPVSQGHILLQELDLVEPFALAKYGACSADVIHLQVEAKRLAFADRAAYLGDPRCVAVPMERLLSKAYAARRSAEISLDRAAPRVTAGSVDHDTTYFCVIDSAGNAISFIQSIFWNFGSAVMPRGSGVLLNNRMAGFSIDPASPNAVAPGKRPAHTLNAYLVTRDSGDRRRLAFVGGTPGGDIQVQSNLQAICNVIDFGMNPQQAIEAPRWQHGGAVGAAGETLAETLAIESRAPEATLVELERRGHRVERIGPWMHGSAYQLIAVHPESGAYLAGSDPRCDGHAAGF